MGDGFDEFVEKGLPKNSTPPEQSGLMSGEQHVINKPTITKSLLENYEGYDIYEVKIQKGKHVTTRWEAYDENEPKKLRERPTLGHNKLGSLREQIKYHGKKYKNEREGYEKRNERYLKAIQYLEEKGLLTYNE